MRARFCIYTLLVSIGLLAVHPVLVSGADPAASLDDHAKAVNRAASTPQGEQRVVDRLSQELKVPAEKLRAQREQSKLGWGELSIAYRLSQKTGVPVEQLIAEHKSGKGWGEIAKEHNVKLGPIISEAQKSGHALEAGAKEDDKPGKADKAEKAEKPEKESRRPGHGVVDRPGGGPGRGRGR